MCPDPIRLLPILLFCILALGCKEKSSSNLVSSTFDSVKNNNELYLIQTDDRFGEWGGNTFVIRVYRNYSNDALLMDYMEFEGNAGAPPPPDPSSNLKFKWFSGQPLVNQKIKMIATDRELHLLSQAIEEMLHTKINNDAPIAMAGVVNRIMYSDSSFILEDYPSTNWDEFQKLKHVLLDK